MLRRVALVALLAACTSSPSDSTDEGSTTPNPSTTAEPTTTPPTGTDTTVSPTGDDTTASPDDTTFDSTGIETTGTTGPDAIDYENYGPHPVGNTRFILDVGDRPLPVEVWYPADASAANDANLGHPVEEFAAPGADRDTLLMLLENLSVNGQIGTRLQTLSAFDAPLAGDGPWPLVVFSHCHNCVRFSAFTVAEHLASHGFLVAAPDHLGNTLFDQQNGMTADIGEEFLVVRVGDMTAVVDALLDPASAAVPEPLRGRADPERVGALGHSFGAATVGRLAQNDPRIKAALPIAAPVENPFFPNTHVADIHVPLLFVLAEEDNSILQIGNNLLVTNYNAANPPVRLITVKDAGHWNFSDICGIIPEFDPGCGEGQRQTMPGVPFTYLDINVGRNIAGSYSLAFFDRWLRDNPDADAYLDAASPAEFVTSDSRQ